MPPASFPARRELHALSAVMFISYLCVAISLPVVPVYVTGSLGYGNAVAGLAAGVAFLSTILTRSRAGNRADRLGAKKATLEGFCFYAAGALVSLGAGLLNALPALSFTLIILGRLLLGLGESLVVVGILGWGIGLIGAPNAGRVMALAGAAMYGAFAMGGLIGLTLLDAIGFTGVMAVATALPVIGWLASRGIRPSPIHAAVERPGLTAVLGQVWRQGLVVLLQGIGFAAIGAFFALYFMDKGWPMAGLGLTAFGAGFVLIRFTCGHLVDRISGLNIAVISLAVETCGQLLIWSFPIPAAALLGAFLTGLGCSLIYPAMGREVVHLVSPNLRGAALGAFSAFQDLAYGLTGPLAGLLADRAGYGSVYLAGGIAAGLGCLIAFRLRHARQLAAAE